MISPKVTQLGESGAAEVLEFWRCIVLHSAVDSLRQAPVTEVVANDELTTRKSRTKAYYLALSWSLLPEQLSPGRRP